MLHKPAYPGGSNSHSGERNGELFVPRHSPSAHARALSTRMFIALVVFLEIWGLTAGIEKTVYYHSTITSIQALYKYGCHR